MPSLRSTGQGIPKLYPNLNPAAAIPVDRDQIFRVSEFFDQFRMTRGNERGQYVPNSKYIFVRTSGGDLMMHPQFRHPAIASGKPVLYAGEAYFSNGRLEWWSNGSGNYRPDAGHAEQAGLPIAAFYSYEDILKGKHKNAHPLGSPSGDANGGQKGKISGTEVQAKLAPGYPYQITDPRFAPPAFLGVASWIAHDGRVPAATPTAFQQRIRMAQQSPGDSLPQFKKR